MAQPWSSELQSDVAQIWILSTLHVQGLAGSMWRYETIP